jgi:hypothetical protein
MDGFHPRHIPIIHHGTRDKATITSAPILICKSAFAINVLAFARVAVRSRQVVTCGSGTLRCRCLQTW